MDLIVYPYIRIITREYLEERRFPQDIIDDALNELSYSFYYQAGFPSGNVRVQGDKNQPIENLVAKLQDSAKDKRPYWNPFGANKILVVRHSPEYRQMFEPGGIELGELGELEEIEDDEDYQIFVKGVNKLIRR